MGIPMARVSALMPVHRAPVLTGIYRGSDDDCPHSEEHYRRGTLSFGNPNLIIMDTKAAWPLPRREALSLLYLLEWKEN